MKILLCTLISLVALQKANSQKNLTKIDSVFKFYFFVFEMETTDCCPREKYPDYYYYTVIERTNDTIYLNKYIGNAAEFIQQISKIKSSYSNYESSGPFGFTVNKEVVEKWKNWYNENKSKLRWSRKKNKPVLR